MSFPNLGGVWNSTGSMRAKSLVQLMSDLDIERSRSLPRVSNDNPYSESQFKTMKYCPQYPGRFGSYESSKVWCNSFFPWYNNEHRHDGIALFTPSDVHTGRYVQRTRDRQCVLDEAFAAHPERFVRGRSKAPIVPREVWINRPNDHVVSADVKESELVQPSNPFGGGKKPDRRLRSLRMFKNDAKIYCEDVSKLLTHSALSAIRGAIQTYLQTL